MDIENLSHLFFKNLTSGRGTNQWESPPGCALFTAFYKISVDSLLGRRLSLIQLINAVAIIQAINRKNVESEVGLSDQIDENMSIFIVLALKNQD